MKNVTLFACLLVLTIGASAQTSSSVSRIAIPPNAHSKEEAHAITVADHAVSGQSASAEKPAEMWTTVPPAKSMAPRTPSQPTDSTSHGS